VTVIELIKTVNRKKLRKIIIKKIEIYLAKMLFFKRNTSHTYTAELCPADTQL